MDWWSYGTLVYEMMCGLPPFYDTNVQRMYHKIQQAPLRFPSSTKAAAKAFLQQLLHRSVERRLGSTRDSAEIKEHEYFGGMDWDDVMGKRVAPEFVPPRKGDSPEEYAKHFDPEFTGEKVLDSVVTGALNVSRSADPRCLSLPPACITTLCALI